MNNNSNSPNSFFDSLAKNKKLPLFVIIAFCIYAAYLVFNQYQAKKASRQELKEVVAHSIKKLNEPETLEKEISPKSELAIVSKIIFDKSLEFRTSYLNALTETGIDNLLDPELLADDPTLSQSSAILQNTRSVIDQYEVKQNEFFDEIPKLVKSSNLSQKEKSSLINALAKQRAKDNYTQEIWRLEKASIDEMEAIINLLKSNESEWDIVDGALSFSSEEIIDQFNQHYDNLNQILAEETQLEQKQLQKAQRLLE